MQQQATDPTLIREIQAKHDIRHSMAIDRTIMANERTLLSYTRTSLTLLLPGVTFVHFTSGIAMQIIGYFLIPLGLVTFIIGYFRFTKKKSIIRKEKEVLQQMLRSEYCAIP